MPHDDRPEIVVVAPANAFTLPTASPGASQQPPELELGQMLADTASGSFTLGPHERYAARQLYQLSQQLGQSNPAAQAHGLLGGDWGYGQDFANDVFEMHSYHWGDCTCGFSQLEDDWDNQHDHTPVCFSNRYQQECERLRAAQLSYHQEREQLVAWARANDYLQAPDGMAVHCDCGVDAAYQAWRQHHGHADTCPTIRPNFRCGTLKIYWYKYIGRSMTTNRPVSDTELTDIFARCFASLD